METIIDGVEELLSEAVSILGRRVKDVIIVGGWGPYLRHMEYHPGTKDVDILFHNTYTDNQIESVIKEFLRAGFFLSAKHDFQIFRNYSIGKQTYIFNIDLLHPTIDRTNKVEFLNAMDLDITIDGEVVKQVRTICIDNGDFLFNDDLTESIMFHEKNIRVLSAEGVVISKLKSCQNRKRPRDIYDIYLSLSERKDVAKNVISIANTNQSVQKALSEYESRLQVDWPYYEESLKDIMQDELKEVQKAKKLIYSL